MFRNFGLVGFGLISLVAAGCRDSGGNGTPVDLSHPVSTDMAGQVNVDMAMQLNYMTTTAHDIDVGTVANKTAVKTTLVVINPPTSFVSSKGAKCTFQVIAQDATCTTAPCGVYVSLIVPFIPRGGTDTSHCPYGDDKTAGGDPTFFANTKVGDNIDVTGAVDVYTPASTSVTQHTIDADSVTASAATATVAPLPVTIATSGSDVQFANCYTGNTHGTAANCPAGASWQTYEGTYVKLSPAGGGVLTITLDGAYNFDGSPGNIYFSTDNAFNYDYHDATLVGTGTTFHSIAGAVDVGFGGQIRPYYADDFTK